MLEHAWDFIFSEGDTIRDKFNDLYDKISTITVRKKDNDVEIPQVICGKEISDCFCVANPDNVKVTPIFNEDDCLQNFYKDCGDNGYCSGFDLYRNECIPENEIRIILKESEGIYATIKVYNFTFMEK